MANIVLLPQIGISEESAVLTAWHVKVGDVVKTGDHLFSLETGKSSFDVESEFSGSVLALLAQEGDELPVKSPVCAIGRPGEAVDLPKPEAAKPAEPVGAPAENKPAPLLIERPIAEHTGVSPRAKRLAAKNEIDPALAAPTGPDGRVLERDVRALIQDGVSRTPAANTTSPAPAAEYEDKPLTTIRKTIASRMSESLQNSAQLTHTHSFDAANLMAYRSLLKEGGDLAGITLGDMVLYAVSRTLPDFPDINAWFMGTSLRVFGTVNLAVAVDTEKGLMVPVIFGASNMSLLEISNEVKRLAEGCKTGSIDPSLLSGGSFTVSNLGQLGVESFTPILNPPQVGILGVNTITTRVREVGGQVKTYPAIALSLTYDHRAIDGAPASRFLQALCKNLENFTTLLAR
ncbi:MAG: 2-oxo acid dehydrogenase subunit E2 [Oscillospiraceae bacterium]|nr:2-oxo acid dehydrogenase subunit E2 [Oscillospiraceae bacterium]